MHIVEAYRHRQGLSRQELASRARLTERTIYNVETGLRSPRRATAVALAEALGIPDPVLLMNENAPSGQARRVMEVRAMQAQAPANTDYLPPARTEERHPRLRALWELPEDRLAAYWRHVRADIEHQAARERGEVVA